MYYTDSRKTIVAHHEIASFMLERIGQAERDDLCKRSSFQLSTALRGEAQHAAEQLGWARYYYVEIFPHAWPSMTDEDIQRLKHSTALSSLPVEARGYIFESVPVLPLQRVESLASLADMGRPRAVATLDGARGFIVTRGGMNRFWPLPPDSDKFR